MAPYPEEVDVFSAPHSRMKALVDVYSEKLTCTDFKDYAAVESLLHDLDHTFCEFKSHEQIENKYIMRKLKKRLKRLSIQDAAVCNCHSDNKLSDMLALVRDGYSCTSKPEEERIHFGIKLQHALQEFTGSFLPHMKEEEEVFQPMLMKYFEYEELKCLKEQVIEEHNKWHVYEKNTLEEAEADRKLDTSASDSTGPFSRLPADVLCHVLSYLPPRELLKCSQVCHEWYTVAHWPSLWKEIYPCYWAHGVWEGYEEEDDHEERMRRFYPDAVPSSRFQDEDADVDEGAAECPRECERERGTLQSMVRHLLPQVGVGVHKIVLASSKSLTSSMLRSILIQCPNVAHLDISYTAILDSAFKGLKEHSACTQLQHLNLSGCRNVSDLALFRLSRRGPLVPEGAHHLRDVYLEDCRRFRWGSLCEIEESAFCSSVCFWKKDGLMCHLAKLSLRCPYVHGPSSVRKAEPAWLRDRPTLQHRSLRYLNVSGCKDITDHGLRCLLESGLLRDLEYLDVSGCWLLTGPELCAITDSLPSLSPENIFYCDRISDGPYPDTANGCQNLESGLRACCCQITIP